MLSKLLFRYCKSIDETDETELKEFAAKRKKESLGKGIITKYVKPSANDDNSTQMVSCGRNKEFGGVYREDTEDGISLPPCSMGKGVINISIFR